MSSKYFRRSEVEVKGTENLTVYRFGDKDVNHCFCRTCGISPSSTVPSVPADYDGPASGTLPHRAKRGSAKAIAMKPVVYDEGVLIAGDRSERRTWAEHRIRL